MSENEGVRVRNLRLEEGERVKVVERDRHETETKGKERMETEVEK